MFIMPKNRSTRGYTIYAIAGTILEVAVWLIVAFVILPLFGIRLEWWVVVAFLALELAVSLFTYIMGRRALSKRLDYGPESIIGSEGIVSTPLNPTGYIKVKGELWKASCQYDLKTDDEVVVTGIKGMKLSVVPKDRNNR
jgi:membrane protein implicated in regulation of membrane protease activity